MEEAEAPKKVAKVERPKSQWGPEFDEILYPEVEEPSEDDREEIWRDEDDEDEEFWDEEPMPWIKKGRR